MPSVSETNRSHNAAAAVIVAVISGLARVKSDEEIAQRKRGRKPRGGDEGIEGYFDEALW